MQSLIYKAPLAWCRRRIHTWRIPPNWSKSDWFQEIDAVIAAAMWQAACDFDSTRGIPFGAFAGQRILARALSRYRQEWAYALHCAVPTVEEFSQSGMPGSLFDSDRAALYSALKQLSAPRRWLIQQLYLEGRGEDEIAQALGISQQAVNQRKQTALIDLRRYLCTLDQIS